MLVRFSPGKLRLNNGSLGLNKLLIRLESKVICPESMSLRLSISFCIIIVSRSKSSLEISLCNVGRAPPGLLKFGWVVVETSELRGDGLLISNVKFWLAALLLLFLFVTDIAGLTRLGSTACMALLRGLMGVSTLGDSIIGLAWFPLNSLGSELAFSRIKSSVLVTSNMIGPSRLLEDVGNPEAAEEAAEAAVDVSKRGSLGPRDSMASGC